jgi:hypothetical protein
LKQNTAYARQLLFIKKNYKDLLQVRVPTTPGSSVDLESLVVNQPFETLRDAWQTAKAYCRM